MIRSAIAIVSLIVVVVLSGGCSSGSSQGSLPPTTSFDPAAPTTLDAGRTPPPTVPDSEKPKALSSDSAVGYELDNGLVLWVVPPVGHIYAGDGLCAHLIGDASAFYAKYNSRTVPGFQGVVCHPASAAG